MPRWETTTSRPPSPLLASEDLTLQPPDAWPGTNAMPTVMGRVVNPYNADGSRNITSVTNSPIVQSLDHAGGPPTFDSLDDARRPGVFRMLCVQKRAVDGLQRVLDREPHQVRHILGIRLDERPLKRRPPISYLPMAPESLARSLSNLSDFNTTDQMDHYHMHHAYSDHYSDHYHMPRTSLRSTAARRQRSSYQRRLPKSRYVDPDQKRVWIWNKLTEKKLTGNAAPMRRNLQPYLDANPHCEEYINQDGKANAPK